MLSLSLEVRRVVWSPGAATDRSFQVFAIAERGKLASIPESLIRVAVGTELRLTLHNRLDRAVVVHGPHDHDASTDSVMLAVGESRAIAFRVVTPGTHCYWGSGQIIGRTAVARRLRLFVTERPSSDTVAARFSYVLQEGSAPPSPDSARRPGPRWSFACASRPRSS